MEYFWCSGGNNRPDFAYRFTVKEITDDMYDWCSDYPLKGPFERWHIIHNYYDQPNARDKKEIPLIQFESAKAAYMFSIAFSEYILEDKTYSFVKKYNEYIC